MVYVHLAQQAVCCPCVCRLHLLLDVPDACNRPRFSSTFLKCQLKLDTLFNLDTFCSHNFDRPITQFLVCLLYWWYDRTQRIEKAPFGCWVQFCLFIDVTEVEHERQNWHSGTSSSCKIMWISLTKVSVVEVCQVVKEGVEMKLPRNSFVKPFPFLQFYVIACFYPFP